MSSEKPFAKAQLTKIAMATPNTNFTRGPWWPDSQTVQVARGHTLGSLSNDDGDDNDNATKAIGLMSKNNRPARAFYILVHFFAVLCKTKT